MSRELMRARAAVLLVTLVVVPLFAALGTSPSRWFDGAPQRPPAQNSNDEAPLDLAERTLDHSESPSNAPRAAAKTADLDVPAPNIEMSVIRDWREDEPALPLNPVLEAVAAEQGGPSRQQQIEGQLRKWGASYYRLERWSQEQPLYRFHCRMSINELKHYNRHFEAVSADPVEAMHSVLEQVRRWREPLARRPT